MEEQAVKNKKSSQRNTQIKVVTSWQHTQELTLAFRRLMRLLLQPSQHPNIKKEMENENR